MKKCKSFRTGQEVYSDVHVKTQYTQYYFTLDLLS